MCMKAKEEGTPHNMVTVCASTSAARFRNLQHYKPSESQCDSSPLWLPNDATFKTCRQAAMYKQHCRSAMNP